MLYSHIFNSVRKNNDFRRVVFTTRTLQVAMMSLGPHEDIGLELHSSEEMWFIVTGSGVAYINEEIQQLTAGDAVMVPSKVEHNLMNIGEENLKVLCMFNPPRFRSGTVHGTKSAAIIDI